MHQALRGGLFALILLSVGGAAAYWGWSWWTLGRFQVATDNAFIHADVTTVSAKVPGYIARVMVDDNQPVAAGATLLQIEAADYRARVEQAHARVQRVKAAINGLAKRQARQRASIGEAQATVKAARAELALAQRELARSSRLRRAAQTSEQAHDRAVTEVKRRQAVLTRAEAGVVAARRQLAVIEAEAAELEARQAEALASLELARIRLSETTIHAPASGVVANKQVEPGEFVRPGTLLLAVVPLDKVWVVANFKATQIERIAIGQRVEVSVDAYPDISLSGQVDSLSPGSGAVFSLLPPDNATGNFIRVEQRVPVKIRLDPDRPLRGRLVPGLLARVTVTVGPPRRRRESARDGEVRTGIAALPARP